MIYMVLTFPPNYSYCRLMSFDQSFLIFQFSMTLILMKIMYNQLAQNIMTPLNFLNFTLLIEKPYLRTNSSKKTASCNLKYPCGICHKSVNKNQKAIFCTVCLNWIQRKRDGTSNKEYDLLVLEEDSTPWKCILCNIEEMELNFHLPIQPKWN